MEALAAEADVACAYQIAERLIVIRWDVDRGELAGAMEPRERVAVAAIRLDPVAAAFRHAGRIDHDAVLALGGEVAMYSKAARPGFVYEAQPPGRGAQRRDHLRQRLAIARNPADVPDLAVAPLLGERDVDRVFVDIHPHEHATFRHGLPPSYVALRIPSRRRAIHDLRREAGLCALCLDSHTV